MSSTTFNLDNVAAMSREAIEQSGKSCIGFLYWSTVPQQKITRDELRDRLITSGLGEDYLPKEINAVDAFKRATSEAETKKVPSENGQIKNYLVRNVSGSTDDLVQRNIVCEIVDPHGKKLGYVEEAAVLIYDKSSGRAYVSRSEEPMAEELAQEAIRRFEAYKSLYDEEAIRTIIRNALKTMAPIPLKLQGGNYFIPAQFEEKLRSLCIFIGSLKEKSRGYMIDVFNKGEHVDMVREQVVEHLRKINASVFSAIHDENLNRQKVKDILEDAQTSVKDFYQYQAIIGDDFKKMETMVNIISKNIPQVLEKLHALTQRKRN